MEGAAAVVCMYFNCRCGCVSEWRNSVAPRPWPWVVLSSGWPGRSLLPSYRKAIKVRNGWRVVRQSGADTASIRQATSSSPTPPTPAPAWSKGLAIRRDCLSRRYLQKIKISTENFPSGLFLSDKKTILMARAIYLKTKKVFTFTKN